MLVCYKQGENLVKVIMSVNSDIKDQTSLTSTSWRNFLVNEGFLWSESSGQEDVDEREHQQVEMSRKSSSKANQADEEDEEQDDETELLASNSELWSFSDPWSAIILALLLGHHEEVGPTTTMARRRQDVALMNCFAKTFRRNTGVMPLLIHLLQARSLFLLFLLIQKEVTLSGNFLMNVI